MKVDDRGRSVLLLKQPDGNESVSAKQPGPPADAQKNKVQGGKKTTPTSPGPVVELSGQGDIETAALYSPTGVLNLVRSGDLGVRVQDIKKQIQAGTFVVYPHRVADGLLKSVNLFLNR